MFAHVVSDNFACSSSRVGQWLERQSFKEFESTCTSDDVPFYLEVSCVCRTEDSEKLGTVKTTCNS